MTSENDRKRVNRWKQQHKELGLCVDCNEKAVDGYIRCQKHLDDREARRKKEVR